MVILRRGLPWIDQETIAKGIGARILAKRKGAFVAKLEVTKVKNKLGIRMTEFKQKKVSSFFKKNKLPLKTNVFYVSEIGDMKAFIKDNLRKGNDVMANFHNVEFDKESDYGHFALISAMKGDKVTLCDPEKYHKSFWEADIGRLVKAMGKKYDSLERGFVVFSEV